MSGLTFLVIEHEDQCPPEWFGQWWAERGVRLRRVRAHRPPTGVAGDPSDSSVPADLGDADALVVMGGEPGANDDARYPWLPAVRALIERTVADGAPFLGICLGHQLAAVALGGAAGPNPHGHTGGLTPVTLTETGRADPLFARLHGARAVQWNNDVVLRVPDGSSVLATAPDGSPQAVRFAPGAYGVQFHPEVSPELFDLWTIDKPSAAGTPAPELVAISEGVRAARDELRATWRPLADGFVDLVAEVVAAQRDRRVNAS